MEIILKEDIIGLGYKNEIVNVKAGYGRNYLIPQGKGVIASTSARKQLAEDMKQQAAKIANAKAAAEKKADALKDVVVELTAKVAATGVLYGSITAAQVAEVLNKLGHEIDKKIVTMRDIKKVGEYEATVHFFKDVEVKVPVRVEAENKPAPKAEVVEAPVETPAEVSEEDAPTEA